MRSTNYACLSEINGRDENEDSYLVAEFTPFGAGTPLSVLAVADGMGGYEHGAQISREVLRHVGLSLFQQLAVEPALNGPAPGADFGPVHLATALQEAALFADARVRHLIDTNNWGKAGAALVIATIYEDEVVALNLGDSPLFHYERASRTLRQLTQDHTVAEALMRGGLITPEMAHYHRDRSKLEFYVGGGAMPQPPPVHYCHLEQNDLLLLCSDGVSNLLSLERMNELLNRMGGALESTQGLANAAETLREAALSAGESDNQTIILWRYTMPAGGAARL
jgi:protein phosphatase